jgi:crotonobetainyl-CoA:carnitine CoA-transferase CaiB-like acyl-CoA transferase
MPLHSLESLMQDEHLKAVGFFKHTGHPSEGAMMNTALPSKWSATQPPDPAPAPRLGEHTVDVLREAGFDPSEIDSLAAAGIVTCGK